MKLLMGPRVNPNSEQQRIEASLPRCRMHHFMVKPKDQIPKTKAQNFKDFTADEALPAASLYYI